MLERDVEKEIRIYAESKGMISIKLSGPGNRGKPDRLFFYRNRCMIREIKRPGEVPTKLQWQWIVDFRDAGFDSGYVDTVGKGKTAIDNFIKAVDAEYKRLEMLDDL